MCLQPVLNRGLFVGEFMLSTALFLNGKKQIGKMELFAIFFSKFGFFLYQTSETILGACCGQVLDITTDRDCG